MQRRADRFQRLLRQLRSSAERAVGWTPRANRQTSSSGGSAASSVAWRASHAHVAVPAQRSLEQERVTARWLLLVEEAEDAEGRQQITGQLDGGRAAPKAGSGAGSSCARL